jgi:hypothetical protein
MDDHEAIEIEQFLTTMKYLLKRLQLQKDIKAELSSMLK